MLNKSLMIKLLMFAMILVGCASNNVAENEVNDINENPKVQDEKVEDNNLSTITENNEVTEYIEQPQPQTESETTFFTIHNQLIIHQAVNQLLNNHNHKFRHVMIPFHMVDIHLGVK